VTEQADPNSLVKALEEATKDLSKARAPIPTPAQGK
jgi:hypothetical protein